MKILPVEADLFHLSGRTDGHDEAVSRFSKFCEGTSKQSILISQAIQHQDSPNFPVKNAQDDKQCPLVRLQPNLAQ